LNQYFMPEVFRVMKKKHETVFVLFSLFTDRNHDYVN